jgi:hypothetical protein
MHIEMEIAQMQDREMIERCWQTFDLYAVVPDVDVKSIPFSTAMQQAKAQNRPNDGVDRIPIFEMKEVEPLTEDLGFMIVLDAEALLEMQGAYTA